jgi:magnesium chelatase subunit D
MSGVWARAVAALDLLRVDPGLGGLHLRARAGPVRDRLLARLTRVRRLDPRLDDAVLFGGFDLTATLASGRLVRHQGILDAPPALLLLPMAERTTPAAAARLSRLIEAGHAVIALDEGAEPEESIPRGLADRLGLSACLEGCTLADCEDPRGLPEARLLDPEADLVACLAALSARLGIDSLRAPLAALRAARASAAFAGRAEVTADDLALAVELVLAPRATLYPEFPEPAPPPEATDPPSDAAVPQLQSLAEVLVEAARAAMPDWTPSKDSPRRGGRGTGSGTRRIDTRQGAPLPSRPVRPPSAPRVDVIATLRAAAPWQRMRGAAPGSPAFRREDLHFRRHERRGDRLLILLVDASGSTAHARLAEAKGAVELMLGSAYVRRDRVALLAFRGVAADVLLPPTRSLVQAKRRLATLAGGGATPLAQGLRAAIDLADDARGHGMTPSLALLTDGRANVALDGRYDRSAARSDALAMARSLGRRTVPGIVIDTGARPDPQLPEIARLMAADYLPLPRAEAAAISAAVAIAFERP